MSHIAVQNLDVQYRGQTGLKNVSVEIPDRSITAVIGPSGCGKTTFLRCLNRLIDMSFGTKVSGEVLIDGINILDRNADLTALRKRMGLLSQRPQVLPMSIYDNVAFGPKIHGIRNRAKLNEIVEEKLHLAGLWEEVHNRLPRPASELSIGQQQRLCLARGLAVEPEVLLCDEPTASLDPISARHIEGIFQDLKAKYSIVLVTHTLRQAKRLADHLIFLYMGELVEHGPAAQILENPQDTRTREYLAGIIG